MRKFLRLLVLGALFLSACSAIPASPQPMSTLLTDAPIPLATTAVPKPPPIETLATPHIDQPPDGAITPGSPVPEIDVTAPTLDSQSCGFQWAYQDLPELSASFQQSLQALQPEAQATAFAFGENCLRPDGTVDRFTAMETDFNITLQVSDTADESELGDWIVKVMQVITAIPPEQIVGPRPGRVSLIFQSGAAENGVNFYIDQFTSLPTGLSSAEIFQALKAPQ